MRIAFGPPGSETDSIPLEHSSCAHVFSINDADNNTKIIRFGRQNRMSESIIGSPEVLYDA